MRDAAPRDALPGRVGGVVTSLTTGAETVPVPDAEILLSELRRSSLADARGRFLFQGVPPGSYRVLVRHPGFRPVSGTLTLTAGDSVDLAFRMTPSLSFLDTVHVAERKLGAGSQEEFERRRAAGFGKFITREQLDQREVSSLADIVRSKVGQVQLIHLASGGWAIANSRASACLSMNCPQQPICFMTIWIDGQRIYHPGRPDPPDLNAFSPTDLAGVEVYRSAAETPPEFNATDSHCGTVVLWTRLGQTR
ncbi:MAG: Plug and carboxypeptidase regulatory-like domain-containing protein [Gemmatimonadota bacterium]|nr:Plug and carboxypeptidase regulatory-like domain-containing protein [Gemmatimonadota bacterium]